MAAVFRNHSPAASLVASERSARAPRAFSFSRLLAAMSFDGSRLDGYEREVMTEISRSSPLGYDPQRQGIPLALIADPTARPDTLNRDLSVGGGSAGGYLVGTIRSDVRDILRPWSISARCGVTVIPAAEKDGPLSIPKTTAATTGNWLASETATITPSQPTLAQISMSRKSAAALIRFSRQLNVQSEIADATIQRELLKTIGQMIDQAVISGTGASGQPTGILNTAGLGTQPGASFGASAALAMEQTCADNNGDDESFAYLTTPAVRKLLRTREIATGSGALWSCNGAENRLAGRGAFASTLMPAATMISGPWSNLLLPIWGNPRIEINPFDPSGFKSLTVDARLVLDVDVAIQTPAAWVSSSSIT